MGLHCSATNLFQGNPDINPSYSNKVDLGYLNKFGKKVTLNSSIYYEKATDIFNLIAQGTDDYYIFDLLKTVNVNDPNFDDLNNEYTLVQVIKRSSINLATNDRTVFEFTLTYRQSNKWNLYGNFNLFNSVT